jgi:hypothetical protein
LGNQENNITDDSTEATVVHKQFKVSESDLDEIRVTG